MDNTHAFETAARFFVNTILVHSMALLFVMTYVSAYSILRPFILLHLLQCVTTELFVRLSQGILMPPDRQLRGVSRRTY
ncbi:unnamed protein product [Amoebophrya sp. A25]|nr:unnamed protein product [Amoebophrya sp. A25]|eukprot:GSA25T00011344001.1